MKRLVSIAFALALVCLFSVSAFAEANYVYHEQTQNTTGGSCGVYVSTPSRDNSNPLTDYRIYNTDGSYTLRYKVEYQFYTTQARVYYTTDGSNPSGSFGVPSGTTQVVIGTYECTFTQSSQVVDVVRATIPSQPAGTIVKYIVSAWHEGGGAEIFGNSAGSPCSGCGFSCSSSACATQFKYSVVLNPSAQAKPANFTTDSKADVSVWQGASTGNWVVRDSATDAISIHPDWGKTALGDIPVPGDYDGDLKIDYAVWRAAEGNWYIIRSSDGAGMIQNWGQSGDKPVPGFYNYDGLTDYAVYRPAEGNWYVKLNGGSVVVRGWGLSTDIPVQADYDGDGATDYAVYRASEGNWYVINSLGNVGSVKQWGASTDKLVPADYDGDRKADYAVFRPSETKWYILQSSVSPLLSSAVVIKSWGLSTDTLVPADYDGDGKADIAVWRAAEGNWYIIQSATNTGLLRYLGGSTDTPVPAMYLPPQ